MATTFFDKGIEQGIEQGIQKGIEQGIEKGRLETVLKLFQIKFGELPEDARQRIENWPNERLDELMTDVVNANSLDHVKLDNGV